MEKTRKKRKLKKWVMVLLIILIILSIVAVVYVYKTNNDKRKIKLNNELLKEEVLSHYNEFVKTTKKISLYDNKYDKVGEIGSNVELTLDEMNITHETKYFKISNFDKEYYVKYNDVEKIDKLSEYSDRYKKYIPFNKNIVTKDKVSLYDDKDLLVYTLPEELDLPIIINNSDNYGIEYNNRLLYIHKDDVKETKDNHNTDKSNTNHIGTLNYHFFWDDEKEDKSVCNQVICHSKSQFKSHLDLIKEMDLLTITMKEALMYIDGNIQLPKSVLITIDDGWLADLGIEMLNEYEMYGTLFLITGSYDAKAFLKPENKYVELQSHTDKLHDGGKCPGGQGGGLKCLNREIILDDLKTSREKLDGAIALCYPFYEYNNYTIELVKEAGFSMAFAGESSYADNHFKVGSNKYNIPRFVIVTYTTMNDLKNYLS